MNGNNPCEASGETEIRERSKTELSLQARESVLKKVADFALTLGKPGYKISSKYE